MVSKTVEVIRDWRDLPASQRGAAVAVGAFDGVHRGHQAVIASARAAAQRLGAPLAVVSFDPHPRRLFQPDAAPFRLMTADQMARSIAGPSRTPWPITPGPPSGPDRNHGVIRP